MELHSAALQTGHILIQHLSIAVYVLSEQKKISDFNEKKL